MIQTNDVSNIMHADDIANVIQLNDIVKTYPMGKSELKVLQGINLRIKKGEMVAIMGPSGSGKSTLLNLIGLLDRPTSGSYILDGKEVSRLSGKEQSKVRGQKIGFIFQNFNLLPYLSALDNVQLGLKYAGKVEPQIAIEALKRVGLADRMKHRPNEMSGGEQQRVAVARAFAKNPPIILADEPTGNLDSKSSKEIMNILTNLHVEQNITLVMITHDPNIAHYTQRIIHIQDGQIVSEEKL
jgi:putative ABC transport system ATP-binding protein